MTITVVNVRTAKQPFVYCGRRNARYGLPQSPLANPIPLAKDTLEERQANLALYERWLEVQKEKNKAVIAELVRLKELAAQGDLYLGCWCKPKICHCDIIAIHLET